MTAFENESTVCPLRAWRGSIPLYPDEEWIDYISFLHLFCTALEGQSDSVFFSDNNLSISCSRTGSSVSGYDDTPSDNSTADAADPSTASPEPSAAPGSSPAAAGPHVATGNVKNQNRRH